MGKPGCDMALRYPLTSDYAQVEPDLRHTTGKLTAERYFAKQCCVYLQSVWGCSSLLKTWFAKTQIPRQPTLSLSLMNICIYTYIRTHTHTYTYIHTYIHTCIRTHAHIHTHIMMLIVIIMDILARTHSGKSTHMHLHVCMHTFRHACIHADGEPASYLALQPGSQASRQTHLHTHLHPLHVVRMYACMYVWDVSTT